MKVREETEAYCSDFMYINDNYSTRAGLSLGWVDV